MDLEGVCKCGNMEVKQSYELLTQEKASKTQLSSFRKTLSVCIKG